jgi:ATP-binding cassette, subfamily C, bacteriocin exporter
MRNEFPFNKNQFMPSATKHPKATFVVQQDSTDCGVACLRSLLRYYGGEATPERLRELSGTNRQGTTLLGLQQVAQAVGFEADGCEADGLSGLVEHGQPCILHVLMDGNLQHYVVWYGITYNNERSRKKAPADRTHLVGDPARGIVYLTDAELEAIWVSKKCLTLAPTPRLVQRATVQRSQWNWVVRLVRDDKELLIAAAVLGLLIAALSMVMAVFSQRLIDDILPSGNRTKLFGGIALVAFLLAVRVGFDTLRGYLLLRQSKAFNSRIIGYFYDSLLRLPKAFFDTRKTGDLVARLNDTARFQRVLGQLSGQMLIDFLMVFVALVFIAFYSKPIAVGLVVALPFYYGLIYRLKNPIRAGQQRLMAAYAHNESNYISTLLGIRTIKAMNRQEVFGDLNRQTYGCYQESILSLGLVQLRLGVGASLAGVVLLMSVLAFASYQVLSNTLKTGELMALLGMASTLLSALTSLALITVPFNEAKVAFERMYEFMGLEAENAPKMPVAMPDALHQVEVKNVSFRFPGRKALLTEISLCLEKGNVTALVGESGSGKSTVVQLLERFYTPEVGQIVVNENQSAVTISPGDWRKKIVAMPQEVHIFNGTLLDNILLGAQPDALGLVTFLERTQFQPFLESLPQGLATLVGEEGINLSGGQKQWVGLMRALYMQPEALLLDEATSAMDAQSEQRVFELLHELRPHMAVLFVMHRLHVLPRLCDQIYILEAGSITDFGTPDKLLSGDNLYSRFWKDLNLGFLKEGREIPSLAFV